MKNISITNRTTKTDGEVRIRFRLRDGRKVDLYHKSDIKASISDLESFDLATGEVKPRKKIYNKDLEKAIRSEISHQSSIPMPRVLHPRMATALM